MGQDSQGISRFGKRWKRQIAGFAGLLVVALPLSPVHAQPTRFQTLLSQGNSSQGDVIINAPIIIPFPYPYPVEPQQRVRVIFVAEGNDWGAVYLDDRALFQPTGYNRRKEFWLDKGAYYLLITGIVSSEVWASGYLDVGRGDSSAMVVFFSKNGGVRVSGDPYAWLPDVEP